MIREVEGDILLSKAQVVAHGVAPGDHFDTGLALALRERWPAMVKDFRHFCQASHPKAGEIWYWGGAEGPAIVNLMVQQSAYGHGEKPGKANLENVHHALKALAKLVAAEGIKSLALPRLATGVGGLDWSDVKLLVEKHLGGLDIPVFVYTVYHKNVAAMELGVVEKGQMAAASTQGKNAS
ncbi:MAG: macro domain-containing protein [Rhodospirillaceae bacterium]|nr:macro domain-containing protein [Rhodospirillaceae bacterium]